MTSKRKTKRSTSSTKEEGKIKEPTWHILKDKTQHKYVQYCRELFESLDTESLDYLSSWKDLMIYKSEDSPIVTLFSKYDAHLQAFKLFLIIARITELQDNKEEPFQHGRTGFGAAQPLYNQHRLCFTLILANMYKEQVRQLEGSMAQATAEIHRGNDIISRLQTEIKSLKAKLKIKVALLQQQEVALEDRKRELDTLGRRNDSLHHDVLDINCTPN